MSFTWGVPFATKISAPSVPSHTSFNTSSIIPLRTFKLYKAVFSSFGVYFLGYDPGLFLAIKTKFLDKDVSLR